MYCNEDYIRELAKEKNLYLRRLRDINKERTALKKAIRRINTIIKIYQKTKMQEELWQCSR